LRKQSKLFRPKFLMAEVRHGKHDAVDELCAAIANIQSYGRALRGYEPFFFAPCPQEIQTKVKQALQTSDARYVSKILGRPAGKKGTSSSAGDALADVVLRYGPAVREILATQLKDPTHDTYGLACLLAWTAGEPEVFRELDLNKLHKKPLAPSIEVFSKILHQARREALTGNEPERDAARRDMGKMFEFMFFALHRLRASAEADSNQWMGSKLHPLCTSFLHHAPVFDLRLRDLEPLVQLARWNHVDHDASNVSTLAWRALAIYAERTDQLDPVVK